MPETPFYQPLLERFGSAALLEMMGDTPVIGVAATSLFALVETLKKEMGFAFLLDITAVDNLYRPRRGGARFDLVYLFRHRDFVRTLALKVAATDAEVPSIVPLYAAANWAEREVYDQYGVRFTGHTTLKRILNHLEFVGHPLRKDYEITKGQYCTQTQDMLDEMDPLLEARGLNRERDGLMILNLGPSHPASHGTIRTLTALDGEKIVAAATEIGYLHRGFEKSCENHTYNQIIPYTDRLNYCSAIMNNIAFARTVETMLGVTLPERGVFIRVIVAELSRVIDHLVCLAAALLDMGAQTNYWYLFNPRNDATDFLSRLTGARLTNSYMRIGGMSHDLYEGWQTDLEAVLQKIDKGIADTLKMTERNRIFQDRLQNVATVTAEQAVDFGFTGPVLRASGVPYDLRAVKPYDFYDTFDFDVVVGSIGDTYDRIMVRFEEMLQSMRIIRQAVKRMPGGPVNVPDHRIIYPPKEAVYGTIEGAMNQFKLNYEGVKVPAGEYYGAHEATNGELGFYIISDGSGVPYKVKVRPPSFYHMASYPKIIEGYQVADAILALGSLNIIAGEMDR